MKRNIGRRRIFMPVFNEIDCDGRVQRIAEALSEAYDVTVFALDSGRKFEPEAYSCKLVGPSRFSRPKAFVHLRFWAALIRSALGLRPDIIHAHDFYTAFPGWLASRFIRCRFVYDAHELMIPELSGADHRQMFFYRLEKLAIRQADLVIACNPERAELMREHYKLPNAPLVVRNIPPMPQRIENTVDVMELYPVLKRKNGLVRLVYQGDVSLSRGLGAFVEAMKHLDDNFQLLIVGGGDGTGQLKDLAKQPDLCGRIVLLGKVPREYLHQILCTCDIGITAYPYEGLNNIYCAPNKVYEYAQAGLPVIATDQPPLKQLVDCNSIGKTVDIKRNDSYVIADAVRDVTHSINAYVARIPDFLANNQWESERRRLLAAYGEI